MDAPQNNNPTLTPSQVNYAEIALWKQLVRQALTDVRTSTPAFLVDDMDPVTQTVTVQIAIQERVKTKAGAKWYDIPPIVFVPVLMPRAGGYSLTLPPKKGTQGLLIFCDTCFDNWWTNGQSGAPPADNLKQLNAQSASGSQVQNEVRRHHVHDCGFFPGMWSQNNLLSNYSMNSMQLRSDDGTTVVDIADTGVTVTSPAVNVSSDTTSITSSLATQGSLVVGSVLELPGLIGVTSGATTNYLPVTIGGVAYKLLLQLA
jgi:phage baseplate assembly protein gpV